MFSHQIASFLSTDITPSSSACVGSCAGCMVQQPPLKVPNPAKGGGVEDIIQWGHKHRRTWNEYVDRMAGEILLEIALGLRSTICSATFFHPLLCSNPVLLTIFSTFHNLQPWEYASFAKDKRFDVSGYFWLFRMIIRICYMQQRPDLKQHCSSISISGLICDCVNLQEVKKV